jgi:hypothetical protein
VLEALEDRWLPSGGLAGYFTPTDGYQHAIVGDVNGAVHEFFFNPAAGNGSDVLGSFAGVECIAGYFTPNDGNQHVIVARPDGKLTDIYFNLKSGEHEELLGQWSGIVAIAGFYSSDDQTQHVIVGTSDGNVTEVFFKPSIGVHAALLANYSSPIVAVGGFFSPDDNDRHAIVATADGDIHEIFYNPTSGQGQTVLTSLSGIVDLAGFYTSDDNDRHVIVGTSDGNVHEIFYNPTSGLGQTVLENYSGIVHIGAYFTPNDGYRHALVETSDGIIHEVFYQPSQGIFQDTLTSFAPQPPSAQDISPDQPNGAAPLMPSTAGRTLTAVGDRSALYAVTIAAGIWKSVNGGPWSQLSTAPGQAYSMAVDPNNSAHLAVGTRDGDAADTRVCTGGVYESFDAGATWSYTFDPYAHAGTFDQVIPALAFGPTSTLFIATANGIGRKPAGVSTVDFSLSPPGLGLVTAISVSRTSIWARTATDLLVSGNDGVIWSDLRIPANTSDPRVTAPASLQGVNITFSGRGDDHSLGAIDSTAVMVCHTDPDPVAGNKVLLYDATDNKWLIQLLGSGDGTGLGGESFVKSFILNRPDLPADLGDRYRLFAGFGQDVDQAVGVTEDGTLKWVPFVETTGSWGQFITAANYNNGAWELTVATPHLLNTGDQININHASDGTNNTHDDGLNGNWTIQVVSPTVVRLVNGPSNNGFTAGVGASFKKAQPEVHSDIWGLNFDSNLVAWVACDGGVYDNVGGDAFTDSHWYAFDAGLDTQNIHTIGALDEGHVASPQLIYPTGDNDHWYQGASGTWQGVSSLGDANWTTSDAGNPAVAVAARNPQDAYLTAFGRTPPAGAKFTEGGITLNNDNTFSGPLSLQFIQTLEDETPAYPLGDAVMLVNLPLQSVVNDKLVNVPGVLGNPNPNGGPVLIRNTQFAASPDANQSRFQTWSVVANDLPQGTLGFWVSGGHANPVYYVYAKNSSTKVLTLYKRNASGVGWTTLIAGLPSGGWFGPAFVNPYNPDQLYLQLASGIWASTNGGTTFARDPVLSALVTGSGEYPTGTFNGGNETDLPQGSVQNTNGLAALEAMSFNRDNPGEMVVASSLTGVFYNHGDGLWRDLTPTLPHPLTPVSAVAVTDGAVNATEEGHGIFEIDNFRRAPLASYFQRQPPTSTANLLATLLNGRGLAMAGAAVHLHITTPGGTVVFDRDVATDASGGVGIPRVMAGSYVVDLRFDGDAQTAPSETAFVADLQVPAASMQPRSVLLLNGATATFMAAASGLPAPTVQWQVSTDGGKTFAAISGATSATLSFVTTAAQDGDQFQAVFTNSLGTVATAPVTLTINSPQLSIPKQPLDLTVKVATRATFTAKVSVPTGTIAPSVQWQISTDDGNTWASIKGATSTALTLPTASLGQDRNEYRAVFTAKIGGAIVHAASNPATLTVQQPPGVSTEPTLQPVNVGATVVVNAAANGVPVPTVQWQVSTDGGRRYASIVGATAPSLIFTATAFKNGDRFRAVFTNPAGTATTTAATLNVRYRPIITLQPISKIAAPNAAVTYIAAATANPPITRIQWQLSDDGGESWTTIDGQTSATLRLTAHIAQSGTLYRAVFTNSVGITASTPATLTVNAAPIITASPVNEAALVGQTVVFSVAATVPAGTPAPRIQWQVSSDGGTTWTDLVGQNSSVFLTLNALAALDDDRYRAICSNSAGATTSAAATLFVF